MLQADRSKRDCQAYGQVTPVVEKRQEVPCPPQSQMTEGTGDGEMVSSDCLALPETKRGNHRKNLKNQNYFVFEWHDPQACHKGDS